MEMALAIQEVKPHGRQIRAFAILLHRVIWSEETRTEYNCMQYTKDNKPSQKSALHSHRALLSVRIRGSAQ